MARINRLGRPKGHQLRLKTKRRKRAVRPIIQVVKEWKSKPRSGLLVLRTGLSVY